MLIDAAHDFGKNTYHSLEVTRRLDELVATGWPVLVAVSNKKFLGETLDVDKDNRLEATLATTALCAWAGWPRLPRPPGGGDPPGAGHGVEHRGHPAAGGPGGRSPEPRRSVPAELCPAHAG